MNLSHAIRSSAPRNAMTLAATLLIVAGPMLAVVFNGHAEWFGAFLAATVVSVLSAVGAMTVIGFGLRLPALLPTAMMGATLVRATISLAGGVIAILQFAVPAGPTMMMILAYYLALLIVECAILYRSLNGVKQL